MNPITVSAQLAAFVWFTKGKPCKRNAAALRFARENWQAFLPLAHRGLGRLLLRIAGHPDRSARRRPRKTRLMSVPVASTTGRSFSIN